jgi:hypothetical protein
MYTPEISRLSRNQVSAANFLFWKKSLFREIWIYTDFQNEIVQQASTNDSAVYKKTVTFLHLYYNAPYACHMFDKMPLIILMI